MNKAEDELIEAGMEKVDSIVWKLAIVILIALVAFMLWRSYTNILKMGEQY